MSTLRYSHIFMFLNCLSNADFLQHHARRPDDRPLSHAPFLCPSLISEAPRNQAPGQQEHPMCPAVPSHPGQERAGPGVGEASRATCLISSAAQGEGRETLFPFEVPTKFQAETKI